MGDRGHNRYGPKTGGCAPFRGRPGTPSYITSPGPRFTSAPSGTLISIQPLGHNRHGPKMGQGLIPFSRELGTHWTESHLAGPTPTSIPNGILSPSSCFATKYIGRKLGAVPLAGGGAGCPSNTISLGWGLPPYQVVSCYIQPFDHNRHGPKIGRAVPFFFWGGVSWVPI